MTQQEIRRQIEHTQSQLRALEAMTAQGHLIAASETLEGIIDSLSAVQRAVQPVNAPWNDEAA